jgi:hypothetical protein
MVGYSVGCVVGVLVGTDVGKVGCRDGFLDVNAGDNAPRSTRHSCVVLSVNINIPPLVTSNVTGG